MSWRLGVDVEPVVSVELEAELQQREQLIARLVFRCISEPLTILRAAFRAGSSESPSVLDVDEIYLSREFGETSSRIEKY